jgi:histidinol dehydrogenase
MLNLPQMQQWKDALIAARLSGVREIYDQNGEKVAYKSDSEMAAALAFAEKQISDFHRSTPRTIVFATHKGIF